MKKYIRVLAAFLLVFAGTGLAVYPFVSNYLYEHRQKEVIARYEAETEEKGEEELFLARKYNENLAVASVIVKDPFDPQDLANATEEYENILNTNRDGIMGYLEIPSIEVRLGIYHGTGEKVLQNGVGHLENTSLPVGGEGTHSVLSAHAGLPEKKLFTDLELLDKGDEFYIHVSGETLAYKVDQIKIVEPHITEDLRIQEGEDQVTLVTCTPYGINSHRLLVRGERIPFVEEEKKEIPVKKKTESQWMKQYFYGIAAGFFLIALIFTGYRLFRVRRK